MHTSPHRRKRRARRVRFLRLESLESRALLSTTTESFTGPSLSDLIQQAQNGKDTAAAAIDRMEQALESQLTSGPLADLTSGTVDGNGFVSEVQSLESSYEQDVDQQLAGEFPNVDEMTEAPGSGDRGRCDLPESAGHRRPDIQHRPGQRCPVRDRVTDQRTHPGPQHARERLRHRDADLRVEHERPGPEPDLDGVHVADDVAGERHGAGRDRSLSGGSPRRTPGPASQYLEPGQLGGEYPGDRGRRDRARLGIGRPVGIDLGDVRPSIPRCSTPPASSGRTASSARPVRTSRRTSRLRRTGRR